MNRFLDIRSYLKAPTLAFRSLRYRNFRYFFFGQFISLPGVWIQNIALGWLVYRLTDSELMLGVVGFAGQIPSLLLTPIAGVFADRLAKRKVLVITQSMSMFIALTMAGLILSGRIEVWHIVLSAVLNGMSVAFDTPFRHAFLVDMIPKREDLPNAIALNSTLFNSARFIGPPIGGLLIAWGGEGFCFLVNGLSYIAVIISLLAMKLAPFFARESQATIFSDLYSGLKYAHRTKHIRILLIMVSLTSLIGLPFQVFMPVFAQEVFSGNAQTLGYLTGSIGAGALTGAFFLASRRNLKSIPNIIFVSACMFSIGLVSFSLSSSLVFSLMILSITGFGMVVQFASSNTIIQTVVDDHMRGRIMALYSMSFLGITPLGSLLTGALAEWIGAPATLTITGSICFIAALWFFSKKGIIRKIIS
ncbi:MAG: MFS transporter [Lentimicrobium sp.]|nr:MFS transporter [Lentimicrobium sp.]